MNGPLLRCVDFVELVTEWMDGELDDATRSEIEEHLVICADCTVFVSQLRLTRRALGDLHEQNMSSVLRDRLLEAFSAWTARGSD